LLVSQASGAAAMEATTPTPVMYPSGLTIVMILTVLFLGHNALV
jgi:hypothetical protein